MDQHLKDEGIYIDPQYNFSSGSNLYSGYEENEESEYSGSSSTVDKRLNMKHSEFGQSFFNEENYQYLSSRLADIILQLKNVEIDPPSTKLIKERCIQLYEIMYYNGDLNITAGVEEKSRLNKQVIKDCYKTLSVNIDKHIRMEEQNTTHRNLNTRPQSSEEKDTLNFYL